MFILHYKRVASLHLNFIDSYQKNVYQSASFLTRCSLLLTVGSIQDARILYNVILSNLKVTFFLATKYSETLKRNFLFNFSSDVDINRYSMINKSLIAYQIITKQIKKEDLVICQLHQNLSYRLIFANQKIKQIAKLQNVFHDSIKIFKLNFEKVQFSLYVVFQTISLKD